MSDLKCSGPHEEAIAVGEQAYQVYCDYNKAHNQAVCLGYLGAAAAAGRQYKQAAEYYEKAAESWTKQGKRFEASEVLSLLAHMYGQTEDHDAAYQVLERCMQIHREIDNKELMAQTWRLQGMVQLRRKNLDAAISCFPGKL